MKSTPRLAGTPEGNLIPGTPIRWAEAFQLKQLSDDANDSRPGDRSLEAIMRTPVLRKLLEFANVAGY